MSAPPQGLMSFPGVDHILSGTFARSHGVKPAVGVLETVPGETPSFDVGTLTVSYGDESREFRDCAINRVVGEQGSSGTTATYQILDRRWKWAYPRISGEYNIRAKDGVTIQRNTKKNRRELAKLLLDAMGESGYNVRALDTDSFPYVSWDVTVAAEALSQLCDSANCRVTLNLDDDVVIVRKGDGQELPDDDSIQSRNLAIDSRIKPDAIEFVAAPTKFQCRLLLGRAVCQEPDGKIVWIEDATYKPDNGWELENPQTFANVTGANSAELKRNRQLAVQWVFRAYEITGVADGTWNIPGYDGDVAGLWQILPLSDGLISTYKDADGILRPNEPQVRGVFWNEDHAHKNTDPGTLYDGDFQVDKERGIVRFAAPVLQLEQVLGDLYNKEAELYLEIAFNVKTSDTREYVRFRRKKTILNNNTEPLAVRHEEIARTIQATYKTDNNLNPTTQVGPLFDNLEDVQKDAKRFIALAERELQSPDAADIEYAGLKWIELDGAIQQVSWQVGPGGAKTRASRNTEFSLDIPKYTERRKDERLKAEQEDAVSLRTIIALKDAKESRV